MSPPRDERGRFVRADGKPTLHRQVVSADGKISGAASAFDSQGRPVSLDGWQITLERNDPATAEWLQLTAPREPEPKGSLWPWLFLVGVLLLVITGMFGAAVDGGLL